MGKKVSFNLRSKFVDVSAAILIIIMLAVFATVLYFYATSAWYAAVVAAIALFAAAFYLVLSLNTRVTLDFATDEVVFHQLGKISFKLSDVEKFEIKTENKKCFLYVDLKNGSVVEVPSYTCILKKNENKNAKNICELLNEQLINK